jgi:diguanylate cyclase (GGDEF)-like protein
VLFAAVVIVIQRNFYEMQGHRFPFASEEFITIVIFLFCGWRFFVALSVAVGTFATVAVVNLALSEQLTAVMQNVFNLVAIGILAGAASFMAEHITRSNFLNNRVRGMRASRDGLTGLFNRRSFDEQLAKMWKDATREGHRVAVMIADVDYFKPYNDTYGHMQGDVALKKVAEVMQQTIARRPLDIAARLGGEEFAVVWFDVSAQNAAMLAERFREAVCAEQLPHRAAPGGILTVSCGYTVCVPGLTTDVGEALKAADAALYRAKHGGRNRVVGAETRFSEVTAGRVSASAS